MSSSSSSLYSYFANSRYAILIYFAFLSFGSIKGASSKSLSLETRYSELLSNDFASILPFSGNSYQSSYSIPSLPTSADLVIKFCICMPTVKMNLKILDQSQNVKPNMTMENICSLGLDFVRVNLEP